MQKIHNAEVQLDDEEQDYKGLAQKFGDKWKQKRSDTLTEKIRAEAAKYRDILTKSTASDETVRASFHGIRGMPCTWHNAQRADTIQILGGAPARLAAAIPPPASAQGLAHESRTPFPHDLTAVDEPASVAALRGALDSLDLLRSERDQLETSLHEKEAILLDPSMANICRGKT
jgi:hypothetical protein